MSRTSSRSFACRACVALVVSLGAASAALVVPADARGHGPGVDVQVSTGDLAATLTSTVRREPAKIRSVTCTLTPPSGSVASVGCGTQTSTPRTKKARPTTTWTTTRSPLDAGQYGFTVTVVLRSGRRLTGSTSFTVDPVVPTCTVTPYSVTYDGLPHSATGSCTGVGGVALASDHLDLSATAHTDAGTYDDSWTFTDPNGNYASRSGTVQDTIAPRSQTISFGAAPSAAQTGGSYTPSATATSGLPVTFSIGSSSGSVCSLGGGTVTFVGVGECTVDANQVGDNNWSAAPPAQQTFAVTAVPSLLPPVPHIDVNAYDDPQSPPVPPDPAAQNCYPQTISGGGCRLNILEGTIDNVFDASATTDPNPGQNTITYHWEIFFPPIMGGARYASSGITGYHEAVLYIRPNSLPTLQTSSDPFWRVRLTTTVSNGVTSASRESWFRFEYETPASLALSTACQRIGHVDGSQCTIDGVNLLPPTEPI